MQIPFRKSDAHERPLNGDVRRGGTAAPRLVTQADALRRVKVLHTVVWAFFASCILTIPVAAGLGHIRIALGLVAVVAIEVAILLVNGFSCPLTGKEQIQATADRPALAAEAKRLQRRADHMVRLCPALRRLPPERRQSALLVAAISYHMCKSAPFWVAWCTA